MQVFATIETAQKALGSVILPSVLDTKDFIKINKNLNYNESRNEKNITVKIAWLRKK